MDLHSYFRDIFRLEPTVIAKTPGRAEILGNYTAYHEGYSLSCATDYSIRVALAPSKDSTFTFVSTHFPKQVSTEEIQAQTEQAWANYPLGICAMLKQAGHSIPPFVAVIDGDIPIGCGLSSSAALEISTALALRELLGLSIDDRELVQLCADAEKTFVGVECGSMDRLSCICTKPGHISFTDHRKHEFSLIPVPDKKYSLAITTSGVTQSFSTEECKKRNRECLAAVDYFSQLGSTKKSLRDVSMEDLIKQKGKMDPTVFRRAKHIIGENERVLKGVKLLQEEDIRGLGILMYASHTSSQSNFENSTPELDMLVQIAQGISGIYGSKLTGKGFGGATVSLLKKSALNHFTQSVAHTYPERTGKEARIFYSSLSGEQNEVHS